MLNVAAELLLQISPWYTVMHFFFNSTQTYFTHNLFINKACALARKKTLGCLELLGGRKSNVVRTLSAKFNEWYITVTAVINQANTHSPSTHLQRQTMKHLRQ